jgi:hypothetical protein
MYCFGLIFLSSTLLAQSKSETQSKTGMAGQPVPSLVDVVKIEGGTELSTERKMAIAKSLQGEVAHSDWLDRLKEKATRQLQNDGYLDGTAEAKVESTRLVDGKEHLTVVVSLTLGTRYFIQQVWWTGSSIFSPAQLDNLSLLQVGTVFRVSALAESLKLLRQAYAERGYGEMDMDPTFQKFPEHGKVALYLVVAEGPKSDQEKPLECKQYSTEDIQKTPYVPSLTYDSRIEGQMQIARARLEAARTNKKLLLIAGGKWCGWCQVLDRTFQTNPGLSDLRDKSFIVVHVNVSEENGNECALKAYPKATSFPFLYVLDATGRLMGIEDTRDWESSDGYDPRQIEAFLKKW